MSLAVSYPLAIRQCKTELTKGVFRLRGETSPEPEKKSQDAFKRSPSHYLSKHIPALWCLYAVASSPLTDYCMYRSTHWAYNETVAVSDYSMYQLNRENKVLLLQGKQGSIFVTLMVQRFADLLCWEHQHLSTNIIYIHWSDYRAESG